MGLIRRTLRGWLRRLLDDPNATVDQLEFYVNREGNVSVEPFSVIGATGLQLMVHPIHAPGSCQLVVHLKPMSMAVDPEKFKRAWRQRSASTDVRWEDGTPADIL